MVHELGKVINSYISFTAEEGKEVYSYFTPLTVNKGTQLVKLDMVATDLYFIHNGAIRTYYLYDVEEINDSFYFEQAFVTSLPSFLDGEPSNLVVETLENCELLCISKERYEKINNTLLKMNVVFRRVIEKAWKRDVEKRMLRLIDTPEQRVQKMLQTQPQVIWRVGQQHIASYLDIPLLHLSHMLQQIGR